jgi:hypothetical protein
MKIVAKITLAAFGLAILAAPAMADWHHHRHNCGWGSHHHRRC